MRLGTLRYPNPTLTDHDGAPPMMLSTSTTDPHVVVAVTGDVDVATAPELRDHLYQRNDDGAHSIVVDLTAVDFIDSVALGVLIGVLKRLRTVEGRFALVAPHERLLKVFRMTALDRVFVIRPTLDAALEALAQV
jgi:anti-sigma B factor antagonist